MSKRKRDYKILKFLLKGENSIINMEELAKENQKFKKLINFQVADKIKENSKEKIIPRKLKMKAKETMNKSNFYDCESWKRMLNLFSVEPFFNEKSIPKNTKINFCLTNIEKIKGGFEKKVRGLIVFLSEFSVYNDVIHGKFLVFIYFREFP